MALSLEQYLWIGVSISAPIKMYSILIAPSLLSNLVVTVNNAMEWNNGAILIAVRVKVTL